MESAFLRQHLVNLPCAFSRIDDAEGLLCFHQPCRQFFLRQDAFPHERNPLEKFKQLIRIGHDFPLNKCRRKLLKPLSQCGLRCRTKHRRCAVMLHQLADCRYARNQIRKRQHLRFVKNNHAVGNVVQLSAFRCSRRIKRFKKLHRRRNHHRRIPVFARQPFPISLRRFLAVIRNLDLTVMLQHVFRAQHLGKNVGILLDDARIRNHVYHALHPVLCRV